MRKTFATAIGSSLINNDFELLFGVRCLPTLVSKTFDFFRLTAKSSLDELGGSLSGVIRTFLLFLFVNLFASLICKSLLRFHY